MESAHTEAEQQMTAKQIENWRKVLIVTLGPYALIMPDEQVQALRNRFQAHLDEADDD